ncbi:MAG TPA: hypothetical protein DCG58_16385 [Hyphomonas adhaerens]|uniref:Uncharacterized protein n=1 Tax=Hyphomonas adhaerens TaxID=81029 RepID=A0A3B9H220_9PROT|nr:hypothetical protein [Hyphomonas sp.]MBB41277.1 hypothetical protein [Hyphomonas sp.]HAE28743.1 hypothetical protein [Hyphomonas adhaerens]
MVRHDVFHNGKSQTGTGDLAATALICPVEAFAQPRQVLALDAGAFIFHPHPDRRLARTRPVDRLQQGHPLAVIPCLARPGARLDRISGKAIGDPHRAVLAAVFDGVGNQVLDDLDQLIPVADHRQRRVDARHVELDAAFIGQPFQRSRARGHHILHVHLVPRGHLFGRLDPRQ